MTRVTCPKCNHTFEIEDRHSFNPLWASTPVWAKYSNAQGLKCECDHCHGLFDEVYMYYDKDYYKKCQFATLRGMTELPRREFFCKDCINKKLSSEQLLEIERDGFILA